MAQLPEAAPMNHFPQEMSILAFTLYHIRFILASDMCNLSHRFGGLGPKIAHLATVLHIGVTVNVGKATAYHRIVCTKMQEKDHKRKTTAADFAPLLVVGAFTI